jgi:Glycosyl hydrolases family 2, sugar binding domain
MPDEKRGYPRPLLVRQNWTSLDGTWKFALDPEARWEEPDEVKWDSAIQVPFSPETPASGIHNTSFYQACWYQREVEAPELRAGQRLLLHFGAVDYYSTVWINGHVAATHEGGYTPITADVTRLLRPDAPQILVVRAEDDPTDLAQPRGKQEWQLEPHSIWYPRTTGIWQTVWFEVVPDVYIDSIQWTPNVERWEIGFEARLNRDRSTNLRLLVKLTTGDTLLCDDCYSVIAGEVHRRIALSDPGIDDYRNELLWSPSAPTPICNFSPRKAP